jgi:lipopolysaccharide heptosyltransferase II
MLFGYLKYLRSYFVDLIFFRRKNKTLFSRKDEIKRVLVINSGHIGELVLATAFLANIRAIFSNAKITFMGGEWAIPVLEDSSLIDDVIIYNSNLYNRGAAEKLSLRQLFKFIGGLMRKDFDLILDLRSDYWIMLYSIICKAKYRIEFGAVRVKKHLESFFCKPTFDLPTLRHYCLQYLDLLDEVGPVQKKTSLYLRINSLANNWVEDQFRALGIEPGDFVVIINPFAEWQGREWSAERFARIADYCSSRFNARIIITGKEANRNRVDKLISHMKTKAFNFVGKTTLKTLIALVSKAYVFISNDGGAMHIASALNVPTIALFGPTESSIFGPFNENSRVIHHRQACLPCAQNRCKQKPTCMELIETEEVIQAIDDLCRVSWES